MPVRKASAHWRGDLKQGNGTVKLGSGAWEGRYSFTTRFEDGVGTNPEELIGAAHAGCFSMAFAARLSAAGFVPESVATEAAVHLEKGEAGFRIARIVLRCEAKVPGIAEAAFQAQALDAKANCPVSQALAAVPIELEAKLV